MNKYIQIRKSNCVSVPDIQQPPFIETFLASSDDKNVNEDRNIRELTNNESNGNERKNIHTPLTESIRTLTGNEINLENHEKIVIIS